MSAQNGNGHKFISHKELADLFGVHRRTFRKELKKLAAKKLLQLQPGQRLYSPAQQKIIFSHLGNPFE